MLMSSGVTAPMGGRGAALSLALARQKKENNKPPQKSLE